VTGRKCFPQTVRTSSREFALEYIIAGHFVAWACEDYDQHIGEISLPDKYVEN
jgi:hypothetical protein